MTFGIHSPFHKSRSTASMASAAQASTSSSAAPSARNSISSLHSNTDADASNTSLSTNDCPSPTSTVASVSAEAKIAQIVAHFEDPALVIAISESEASSDKGYLGGWVPLGGGTGKKRGLSDEEKFWLSRQCIVKYLEAVQGDALEAISRLTNTLIWRRSFDIPSLSTDPGVETEAARCKHFYYGHDKAGRPVHYVAPTEHASTGGDEQIKHAVWFAEMAQARYKGAERSVTMLVDFRSTRGKSPSMGTARQAIHILQAHYPNRLHVAYCRNLSAAMSAFVPIASSFLDARTKAKLKIEENPLEEAVISKEDLLAEWGGDAQYQPDHPGLYHSMKRDHQEWYARTFALWKERGGHVGEDELALIQ